MLYDNQRIEAEKLSREMSQEWSRHLVDMAVKEKYKNIDDSDKINLITNAIGRILSVNASVMQNNKVFKTRKGYKDFSIKNKDKFTDDEMQAAFFVYLFKKGLKEQIDSYYKKEG